MTNTEKKLWHKIYNFSMDDPGSVFTFSKKLARENNWNSTFTQRAIVEYKKFIFLCCIADVPMSPSDVVDQVWHLHMIYTRSYWEDFCKNTLGQSIHHQPSKGGQVERKKYGNLYGKTELLYQSKFGQALPQDIWPDENTRFSQVNFKRINMDRYWTIPKASLRRGIWTSGFATLLLAPLFLQADGGIGSVGTILMFYGIIMIIALIFFAISQVYQSSKKAKQRNKQKAKNTENSEVDIVDASADLGFWALFWGDGGSDSGSDGGGDSGCGGGCGGCGGCG